MVTGEYFEISKVKEREERNKLIGELYNKLWFKFYHIALKYVKDEELARECVQECFKNGLKGFEFFRNESRIETWLTRILINVCLQKIKREHVNTTQIEISNVSSVSNTDDPFTFTYKWELKEIIMKALSKLKEIHRTIILEHDLMGEPLTEIARKHNLSVGTAKSRLFYGRRELKNKLTSMNFNYY